MSSKVVLRKGSEEYPNTPTAAHQHALSHGLAARIHVTGASAQSKLSRLGSLTERYGMCMYVDPGLPQGTAHASIAVPAAETQVQADDAVAELLARIAALRRSPGSQA